MDIKQLSLKEVRNFNSARGVTVSTLKAMQTRFCQFAPREAAFPWGDERCQLDTRACLFYENMEPPHTSSSQPKHPNSF
ncbi:hypothetical protein Pmani_008062 [Petrolisthes manimaculis]|uniref:Uncharacterized protein n=1 Tax=Petrolisthes manimaculis TaxID=1843537 RepID=A0AAE1Q9M7_9EUCA|nr:hypothetical protein Pmani_008062 [Petrolisthes manimaculis]